MADQLVRAIETSETFVADPAEPLCRFRSVPRTPTTANSRKVRKILNPIFN